MIRDNAPRQYPAGTESISTPVPNLNSSSADHLFLPRLLGLLPLVNL